MEFYFQREFIGEEFAKAVLWSKIAAGTVKMSLSPRYVTGISLSTSGPAPFKLAPGGKLAAARAL